MSELGAAVRSAGRVYFTGGVSAVLLGWREMTIDVDLKAEPEPTGFFECLPLLKDRLDLNIELTWRACSGMDWSNVSGSGNSFCRSKTK